MKSALLVSAFFLLSPIVLGQGKVLELIPGTDRLEYDEKTGVHKLIGNVNFIYQGNTMYCDSAYYFEKKNAVKAYGKVHVNKRDTLNMFCDSLYYDGKTKMAKLWGNVRVRDNEFKLTTDSLDYDAEKGQAFYTSGGRVEGIISREVLTSKVGYFHPESKNFFFSKEVNYKGKDLTMTTDTLRYLYHQKKAFFYGPTDIHLDSTDMYCESGWYNTETQEGSLQQNAWISRPKTYISGDTLLYQPTIGTSIGIGNVYYRDSTQNMYFNGEYAEFSDSSNYSFITGNAIASKEFDTDTMHLHADTLYSFKKDSIEYIRAYHQAAVFSNQFQCKADSISYSPQDDLMELYTHPMVWSNGAELKGDFMDIHLKDSVIERVNIHDHSTVLMEVAQDSFYNQIGGKDIIAVFKDNKLHKTFVKGNAITVFFPEDDSEISEDSIPIKKRMGMNRLYASDLRIDLDSNEVIGITYLETPDGAFYPMDQLNKDDQYIPGFDWKMALRPKSREELIEK
ncbi:MAG: hypothetical protein MK066_04960 [Crocinitomicaceae bacterium]|nr:hypothetical protein [Crocinitomicaceae bacterium]